MKVKPASSTQRTHTGKSTRKRIYGKTTQRYLARMKRLREQRAKQRAALLERNSNINYNTVTKETKENNTNRPNKVENVRNRMSNLSKPEVISELDVVRKISLLIKLLTQNASEILQYTFDEEAAFIEERKEYNDEQVMHELEKLEKEYMQTYSRVSRPNPA